MAKKGRPKKKIKTDYSIKHIYKVNDIIKFTWIGHTYKGTIIELTYTLIKNINVATYKIKNIYSGIIYNGIGVNNDTKYGNIIEKIINDNKNKC